MAEKKYALSTAAGESHELIEIGGREFKANPFTLREADRFEAGSSYDAQLAALAEPLERRALDGEPVTKDFLLDHITRPFLTKLLRLLVNGTSEVVAPKR